MSFLKTYGFPRNVRLVNRSFLSQLSSSQTSKFENFMCYSLNSILDLNQWKINKLTSFPVFSWLALKVVPSDRLLGVRRSSRFSVWGGWKVINTRIKQRLHLKFGSWWYVLSGCRVFKTFDTEFRKRNFYLDKNFKILEIINFLSILCKLPK